MPGGGGISSPIIESSQTWLFQTWLFAIFMLKRSLKFTLFCAFLRSFALFCGLSFALICVLLRATACFCERLRLERPRLGTPEITLIFLSLPVLEKGKPPKKARICSLLRTPKISGKEREKRSKKQGSSLQQKKQGNPEKQGEEDQGSEEKSSLP